MAEPVSEKAEELTVNGEATDEEMEQILPIPLEHDVEPTESGEVLYY